MVFSLLNKPFPPTLVILTYHSIKTHQLSKFERHMDELLKRGSPVSAAFANPLRNTEHHIAVTFDDGFQSVIDNALPEMRKRQIPATFFVTTGYLGKKPGWICDSNHENANEVLITEKQLKQLPNNLITIGSHCVTHLRLARIGKDMAMAELTDSKKTLEKISNTDIALLSLPHGSYNERVLESAREAGYKRVFSNIPTFPSSKIREYLIGRITVSLDDWFIEYRLKLRGDYQWLPLAVVIKQKVINLRRTILGKK